MRRLRLWLLSALALGLATTPPVALAGAGEGVGYRLTGGPGSTLTGGFIRLPTTAGSTIAAHFVASNTTKQPVSVSFYGADGNTTLATGAVFGDSSPTDAGAWITPSRRTATLPAGSELPIDVTVRVPARASVGDHVGAVIMEQQDSTSTATVRQVVRYAVPLLIDIGGGSGPQLELGEARLGWISGTDIAAAILPLRNIGTRICRPVVSARIAGDSGGPITVTRQLDDILPGDRIAYPLRLTESMKPGSYLVRADVSGCGSTVWTSSSATLDSRDQSSTQADASPNADSGAKGDDSQTIAPVPLRPSSSGAPASRGKDDGDTSERRESGQRDPVPGQDDSGDDQAAVPAVPRKPPNERSWLPRAGDAVAENGPKVLARASVPIGASALVGLLFFFQNALDRRDPKLAGAPRERDAALRFDPNPLHS